MEKFLARNGRVCKSPVFGAAPPILMQIGKIITDDHTRR
jgi:hypothetical protein